jgi:hypothetical protein
MAAGRVRALCLRLVFARIGRWHLEDASTRRLGRRRAEAAHWRDARAESLRSVSQSQNCGSRREKAPYSSKFVIFGPRDLGGYGVLKEPHVAHHPGCGVGRLPAASSKNNGLMRPWRRFLDGADSLPKRCAVKIRAERRWRFRMISCLRGFHPRSKSGVALCLPPQSKIDSFRRSLLLSRALPFSGPAAEAVLQPEPPDHPERLNDDVP